MAEKKTQNTTIVSPTGLLMYPRLDTPDAGKEGKFAYKVPVYKTGLRLERTAPGVQAFLDKLDTLTDEAYAAALADEGNAKGIADAIRDVMLAAKKKNPSAPVVKVTPEEVVERAAPYKIDMDEDFNELGTVTLQFKMNSVFTHPKTKVVTPMRPEIVDAKKNKINPLKTKVWGGTVAKVAFQVKGYGVLQGSAGLARYLLAVQVLELADSTGGGGASAFDTEDGFDSKGGVGSDFEEEPGHQVPGDQSEGEDF